MGSLDDNLDDNLDHNLNVKNEGNLSKIRDIELKSKGQSHSQSNNGKYQHLQSQKQQNILESQLLLPLKEEFSECKSPSSLIGIIPF